MYLYFEYILLQDLALLWIYVQLACIQPIRPADLHNTQAAHVNVFKEKEKRLENGDQREAHENRQNVANCACKVGYI